MKRKYPVINIEETGKNIKRIMLLKGLTVKDIQKFFGLSTPQSIYHWFDGRNLPSIDNLYALSEIFGLFEKNRGWHKSSDWHKKLGLP